MNEKQTLYIPMGVKTTSEIFPGFSKYELLEAGIGSIFFIGLSVVIFILSQNVSYSVIFALTGVAGSVIMTIKDESNLSVVEQSKNMIRFIKGQKVYPYVYGDEWGIK